MEIRSLAAGLQMRFFGFQSWQTTLRHRDLTVHQQGQQPITELGEMLVFHASCKDHLVIPRHHLVILRE